MKFIDESLEAYCMDHSGAPSAICGELAAHTKAHISQSQMLIGPMEAAVLGFLIRSIGARRVLEFGTYTGYSALAMSEHLPADGELITLDINEETTALAKTYWAKSQHAPKIKAFVGPALETLKKLEPPFDFVFIDADKENYLNYFEAVTPLLSGKAVVVVDNCLWSGRVIDGSDQALATKSIRAFNKHVYECEDLYTCLLPVRDGMMLIRKI